MASLEIIILTSSDITCRCVGVVLGVRPTIKALQGRGFKFHYYWEKIRK